MYKENEIGYIARHFRKDAFNVRNAWENMSITDRTHHRLIRLRLAAACVAAIIMSATAAIYITHKYFASVEPAVIEAMDKPAATSYEERMKAERIIDFEETPLPRVVAEIESVYGVEVTGLPENAETLCLSLRYEGTAADLVNTINDILATDMTILEP